MNRKVVLRFDVSALRDLAGAKVFARGEAYFRDGHVALLAVEPKRVLAQVAGTEDYRVELTGRGKTMGGSCSCPAFEDWGVCKHMVAAALAANDAGGADSVGALGRIRDYLGRLDAAALAAMIVDLAERDPALFRKLEVAAAVSGASTARDAEARLSRALLDATRVPRDLGYRQTAGWADGVSAVLDAVAALVPVKQAALALKLAEQALDRLARAVEEIDDSDGHGMGLLEQAADIHLEAATAAKPEPEALARFLFERETGGDGIFFGAAEAYAKVLGKRGLAAYRRLALAAWEKLPARTGARRKPAEFSFEAYRLTAILDFFAERDDDLDARIALRAADLSSSGSYLQLAEFCLQHKREADALRWAEEGLWTFADDRPDERLVFFAVDRCLKAGKKVEAEKHLRSAFEKEPSLTLYSRWRELGGTAARDAALDRLKARLAAKPKRMPWLNPADLLARVLTREAMFDEAWATTGRHGASMGVREALAMASEATHPREALAVFTERAEQLAESGGNDAYAEAAKLIARMAALRSQAEQAAFVENFKIRFGRRRNLMKLLA